MGRRLRGALQPQNYRGAWRRPPRAGAAVRCPRCCCRSICGTGRR